jgi:hypothetical protein
MENIIDEVRRILRGEFDPDIEVIEIGTDSKVPVINGRDLTSKVTKPSEEGWSN